MMMATIGFVPAHQTRSATIRLDAPPGRAFEMFTPLGERAWAHGWDPEFLHPLDGDGCEGSVFITRAGGVETIWTTIAHHPPSGAAYSRVTTGLHAVVVQVRLRPADDGGTLADVSYAFTALTLAGNEAVAEMVAGFDGWMEEWESSINRALSVSPVETARENSVDSDNSA
ncbi:MAG TPA: SRPBCC family protein [Longimicrobium sp.]|nr:SRPBCC family protein [Longimicrobium sp.]